MLFSGRFSEMSLMSLLKVLIECYLKLKQKLFPDKMSSVIKGRIFFSKQCSKSVCFHGQPWYGPHLNLHLHAKVTSKERALGKTFFICWITLHLLKFFRSAIAKKKEKKRKKKRRSMVTFSVSLYMYHKFPMLGNICNELFLIMFNYYYWLLCNYICKQLDKLAW